MLNWFKHNWAGYLLVSMYVAGTIGMAINIHPDFPKLTPFNMIASLAIVLYYEQQRTQRLFWVLLISFFGGFFVEALGVETGHVFGQYEYGDTLGWKIMGVPLVIGVNWALLIYTTANFANYINHNAPKVVRAVIGAALMTGLDFLIEPVAIKLDFWTWAGGTIPTQNYVGWFVTAFLLSLLYQYRIPALPRNRLAIYLYGLMIMFFGILNLVG